MHCTLVLHGGSMVTHLRSTLLSADAEWYSLCSSVRSSFTAACRALGPTSLFLKISVVFCPGKPVAALRSLALTEGFHWASSTNIASRTGQDMRHNLVCLPTCPSLRYFCSHALAVDFVNLQCCHLILLSKGDDTLANRPIMVIHHDGSEEGMAWTLYTSTDASRIMDLYFNDSICHEEGFGLPSTKG